MNVTGKTMLFRSDFDGDPAYCRKISDHEYKDGKRTGKWLNRMETVQMPKGTDLPDWTNIYVIDGFEGLYFDRHDNVCRKLIVKDYKVLDESEDDK